MALPLMLSPVDINWVDKRRSPRSGITDATSLTGLADFASPATLDAALAAEIPTYYTTAKLNALSINDKVWALRQLTEPTSI